MPVPSQDGFMFYIAKRLGLPILRTKMKGVRGWEFWSTEANIVRRCREVMDGIQVAQA